MTDWNPDLYLRFEAERTRPAAELLARISHPDAGQISDLGCGPGNSTELLLRAYPDAVITGVDSSAAMLESARHRLVGCRFQQADIRDWRAPVAQDIIYANASLQWVPDHHALIAHLTGQLAHNGVLAVQMPDNLDQPSHRLMREVAGEAPWHRHFADAQQLREKLPAAETYYDLLADAGCQADIWRTTYYHVLPHAEAIVDWLKATGLRPFLQRLTTEEQAAFLALYLYRLKQAYTPRSDGSVLLAFPRLFIVGRKR